MPANLDDWPFNQPAGQQAIMCHALADATTPEQVRAVLAAFLVGDLVLGMVVGSPDQQALWARPEPARPRRRWRPW